MRPIRCAAWLLPVTLLGCAAQPTFAPGATRQCNPGQCTLYVRVDDCGTPGGVVVDPDVMEVLQHGVVTSLEWRLTTPGYLFAPSGIKFKTDHGGDFDAKQLGPDGRRFVWRDHHQRSGEFPYAVNVVATGLDPRPCEPLDPLIKNQ